MMMANDEWARVAMKNDRMVAELLLRFKQAQPQSQAATPAKRPEVIPLRWGLRLPRSRPATVTSFRCDVVSTRKEGDSSTRCSPTTPLSWSGGGAASPSATADGFEETSQHDNNRSPSAARSKGTAETTSTITKRSRKRKTFTELKDEESSLLKERNYLKKELATLHATFKEERARNETLKKMKIESNLYYAKKSSVASNEPEKSICSQTHQREASSLNDIPSTLPRHAQGDKHPQLHSCQIDKAISNHDRIFVLPDLNMMPPEEDCDSRTLYKMR